MADDQQVKIYREYPDDLRCGQFSVFVQEKPHGDEEDRKEVNHGAHKKLIHIAEDQAGEGHRHGKKQEQVEPQDPLSQFPWHGAPYPIIQKCFGYGYYLIEDIRFHQGLDRVGAVTYDRRYVSPQLELHL